MVKTIVWNWLMTPSNKTGKALQDLIKLSATQLNLGCVRFKDAGFVGDNSEQRRFTSRNVADFIIYGQTCGVAFVEAKNRESSLTFADITQSKDLIKLHQTHQERNIDQALCGIVVLFRNKNKVFWIPVQNLSDLEKQTNKKSFNAVDVITHQAGIELPFFIPAGKRKPLIDLSHIQ